MTSIEKNKMLPTPETGTVLETMQREIVLYGTHFYREWRVSLQV